MFCLRTIIVGRRCKVIVKNIVDDQKGNVLERY